MTTVVEAMKALMEDERITEIMVDAPDQVYVEREGELEDVDVRFADEQAIVDWANGVLAAHGCEPVGAGRPWTEECFRDGSHMLVVIPPVAVSGPNVVIRKPVYRRLNFDQLLSFGSLSQSILSFLEVIMQAKLSVIVSGNAGSGKTTLARAIVELVPSAERVVVVGDSGTMTILRIQHDRLVSLEAPLSGEVEVSQLLRLARHMRPDRIVYAELSGAETVDVLEMMNTGHNGFLTTIHADNPRDALRRVERLATVAEPGLTLPVIRAQIADAVDLVIQGALLEDGKRKVISIAEVQGLKGDSVVLQELFTWHKTGMDEDGHFTGVFKATGAVPSFVPKLQAAGLTFPEGMFEA